MNASTEGYIGIDDFVADFNKGNKQGYKLIVNTPTSNPADYTTDIYKNNKLVGTSTYKKIKDIND